MKDQKHAEMLKAYAKWYLERFKGNGHDVELEIEVPFNHYGERGFIDLLARRTIPVRDSMGKFVGTKVFNDICELKTRIEDFGETIRQVKRAKAYFPLARNLLKSHCFAKLVLLDTPENHRCIEENWKLIEVAGIDVSIFNLVSGIVLDYFWIAGEFVKWHVAAPSRREGC